MQPTSRWNADLETGNPEIDREHRELVAIVDQLKEAAASGDQRAVVSNALDLFRSHTREHFPHEESAMEAAHYPALPKHAEAHGRLADLVVTLGQKQDNGETVLYREVDQLANALYRHILLDDKPFADFLKKR